MYPNEQVNNSSACLSCQSHREVANVRTDPPNLPRAFRRSPQTRGRDLRTPPSGALATFFSSASAENLLPKRVIPNFYGETPSPVREVFPIIEEGGRPEEDQQQGRQGTSSSSSSSLSSSSSFRNKMLKFRVTNSVKARRAAEAQRKALEEKLAMEWAWKPMAAFMNEAQTDLVYWVPPLYQSNVLSLATATAAAATTGSGRPSISVNSVKKKKLSKRRGKLVVKQQRSCDIPSDASGFDESDSDRTELHYQSDDDRESGIHDDTFDTSMEEGVLPGISEETCNRESDFENSKSEKMSKTPTGTPLLKKKGGKCRGKVMLPSLVKILDKVSGLYAAPSKTSNSNYLSCKPPSVAPHSPLTPRNSSRKNPRRPSVKVYRQRLPLKRTKSPIPPLLVEEQLRHDDDDTLKSETTSLNSTFSSFSTATTDKSSECRSVLKEDIVSEMRKVHLEMLLQILAQLYEEKIQRQGTEIHHLRLKVMSQEKLIKRMAQYLLGLRNDVASLKKMVSRNDMALKEFKGSTLVF